MGAGSGAVTGRTEYENNSLHDDEDELEKMHGSRLPKIYGINIPGPKLLDENGEPRTIGGAIAGGRGSAKPVHIANESVRFIEGVTVKDIKTGQTFSGTVDLKPTLDRIASGGTNPHRNDGSVFKNLPDRITGQSGLPIHPTGYYKEYVQPTPNISGPGPQRIIVGQSGEAYYTNDHYKTFIKIR